MNNTETYASVTAFAKDSHDCNITNYGGYSDSTERLHSVNVHDVTKVTRKTRKLGDSKVCVITIETPTGTIDINTFLQD